MNDLPWIKYEPRRMFLDLIGMSPWGKISHVALFNYTLFNDGPPPNDNEKLREITNCPAGDWGRTKLELMTKGWMETNGYFLHRGTIKTLNEAKETHVANQNRSLGASKASYRLELRAPDANTGVVSFVTATVTPSVTPTQEQEQEQEQRGDHQVIKPLKEKKGGVGGNQRDAGPVQSGKRKAESGGQRTTFSQQQQALAATLDAELGAQWAGDREKWLARIRDDYGKAWRVVAELQSAVREHRINTTPAQYAEDTWQRFK